MVRFRRRPVLVVALPLVLALALLAGAAPAKISGKIVEVNLHARTLVLANLAPKEKVTLLVDDQSVIVLDGDDKAELDDLYEGDEVVSAKVRELTNGRLLLLKATVTSDAKDGGDPAEDEDSSASERSPAR
jgi:hypothetical protein